jgi:anaerobic dimethyl sulfoxide reductase subunit B (iron-sulfur subunit)
MACVDYHDLPLGRRYRRVIDYEGGLTRAQADDTVTTNAYCYHVSLACNHCEQPACMRVCPTGAMHKNELGLVCVDVQRCIGCGYCTIACPYHAPSIDPELKRSSKCDGCSSRIEQGLRPICVDACPLRALEFGEMSDLAERHPGCVFQIMPLPDPANTEPNLLILPSEAATRATEDQEKQEGEEGRGIVTNYDEIMNNVTGDTSG